MPERHRPARAPRTPVSRRLASLRRGQRRQAGIPQDTEHPGPTESSPAPAAANRRRLRRSLFHPGRGQLIAAVILFVAGLGGVMQIRSNAADDTYANARREDLIQLLDGLGTESRRLEGEIAELERTRAELRSGADRQRIARAEAERRISELSILAGTAPATGPGIRMRISDPRDEVDGGVLLDAVEEMRDAGAEAIEVNDMIRVVGSSWFGGDGTNLVIDGRPTSRPITIEVIGDANALEEAARFRGGLVSEITGPTIGGQVQIERLDRVLVESLHPARENQYARPAATPR